MPLGFHSLHDVGQGSVPESNLVDIVAVHDVHEDSLTAWAHPASSANWLSDFLPEHIRVARVVSYGYDVSATALFASDASETLQRMAESLVQGLRANRQFAGALRRPIIFVCHGLGGVLVKKSLIYSSTRTAPKVVHLWDQFVSTFAILFFGTPHGRTSKPNWLDFANTSRRTRRSLQQAMERLRLADDGDAQLPELVDSDFAPLVKQFHMFYFWEGLPTWLGNRWDYVVDSKSAAPKLDNTESARIHASHADMVRFETRDLSDYRTVVAALATYCEKAPAIITHRWRQAELALRQLRAGEAWELGGFGFDVHVEEPFRHRDISLPRHVHLPSELTTTYIGRQDLLQTLRNAFFPRDHPGSSPKRKSFVVFGMGGSGKTELCAKYATDNLHEYTAVFTIRAASNETIKESFCRIGEVAGLEATVSSGRHFLAQQAEPWLLIIDNADDRTLELRDLFPSGNAAHILITTRVPDFRREGMLGSLEVKGLDEEEALQLLLMKADIPQPWDPPTTKTGNLITKALGYLALALIQAGNCIYRGVCELSDYLDIHSLARKQLQGRATHTQVSKTDDTVTAVYSTFDVSLRLLLKEETTARRDASDILKIIAFFHFELIPLDIFSRATANRSRALRASRTESRPLVSMFTLELLRRFESPAVLPNFLKGIDELDKFRVNWAIAELQSLSFVRSDGRYLSLHPLIHAWARDSLSRSERQIWARIALNTIIESISLPPEGSSEADGEFHADVLPHLDACLAEHSDPLTPTTTEMGRLRLYIAKFTQPTLLLIARDEIQKAAKCGWVYAERGRFEKAARHLRMVKDSLMQLLGPDDNKTMTAMLGLAGVCWGLGRLDEAIDLQQSVANIRSRVLGPSNVETLSAMNHLGKSYWLHGQYREALELQQQTADRMKEVLGTTHSQTLEALDNLGVTLGAWRRLEESVAVHEEVLSARVQSLGETHLDTITTKANLAMAFLDLGRLEEAKSVMEQVYHQRQKQLGKEHPWTLWALCYLAKIDTEMGSLREAEQMLDWGIAAGTRSLSEDHLGVLMGRGQLAIIYARTNRLDQAEELAVKTLESVQASRGVGHPDCVYALWKLAQLHMLKGSYQKAAEACRLGLQRADMRITREHPLATDLEDLLKESISKF